jgi:hypothetical protein
MRKAEGQSKVSPFFCQKGGGGFKPLAIGKDYVMKEI